ncbi:MAG: hypothetical protein PHF88_02025, partial [Candidatus Pacebacteria bacterium]|nr:hypothetical protein [Candidatus Paceibacterota bacterium]
FNLLLKKLQTLEDVALLLELPLDEYQIKRVVTASKRLIKTFEDAKWCHESLPPRFQKVFLPIMIRKAVTFKDLKWFLEEKIDLKRHQRERVLRLIFEKPKTFEECHWLLMKKIFKGLRKQKIFRLAFSLVKTFADAKLLWDVNNSYYHDKKWEEEILVLLEIEAKSSQEWQWFFGILSPIDRKRPKIWFLLARRKEKSSEDIKWLKKTEIFYHSNEHRPRIWSYYKAEVKDFNDCTYLLDLDCLSPGQKKEVYILLAKKTENASHCQWISNNVNPKHINNDLKEKIFTIMTKD